MSDITVYYLEMHAPEELRAQEDSRGLQVAECEVKQYPLNRFLYQFVGEAWDWKDRLIWSDQQWQAYAESAQLRTWLATSQGSPAGYYELQRQDGDQVEIKYFGLAPAFIGRGYGSYLLTHAIRSAWDWGGTRRVWVHTCSLDHPSALANYKARGLSLYKTTREPN